MVKTNGQALNLKEIWTDRTNHAVRQAQRKLKTAGRAANDYIQENPGKSAAISAGIGFLLGLFFTRGRRD